MLPLLLIAVIAVAGSIIASIILLLTCVNERLKRKMGSSKWESGSTREKERDQNMSDKLDESIKRMNQLKERVNSSDSAEKIMGMIEEAQTETSLIMAQSSYLMSPDESTVLVAKLEGSWHCISSFVSTTPKLVVDIKTAWERKDLSRVAELKEEMAENVREMKRSADRVMEIVNRTFPTEKEDCPNYIDLF